MYCKFDTSAYFLFNRFVSDQIEDHLIRSIKLDHIPQTELLFIYSNAAIYKENYSTNYLTDG